MNLLRAVITALFFLGIPAIIYAQPANDECSNAVLLTSSTSCVNTGGTNVNATYNPSTFTAGCGATNKLDVWYRFVAVATTQTITVSSGPSQIRVELFSGSCGSLTSLICNNTSITYTSLTIGATYYIRVYTQNSNTGTFNICVTYTPPVNDDCAAATSLTSNTTCVNTAGTLNTATANGATALGCFAAGTYYDVWYSFVAEATTETVTISGLGANITNPRIQIYTSACAALGSPVCGNTTITQTGLTIGTTYKIRVANLNSNPSGAGTVANFNICVTHTPPANDDCSGAISLTSGTSCVNNGGTLVGASYTSISSIGCGTASRNDVWYSFVAVSANTTITLSSAPANPRIQLFSGSCASLTSVACASGTSLASTTLTPGTTYYVRIYTDPNTISASNTFNICITHTGPSNDDCSSPILLTSYTSCVNTAGTLNLATASGAIVLGCHGAGTYYDVWYSFVAAATSQTVTLSSIGANITNPRLQIYTNACAALGSPVCGTTTITQTGLTIGTTYKIRVSNMTTDPSGTGTSASFNICVTHTGLANDECQGAISITSGTSCSATAGTLVGATYLAGLPACGGYANVDAWYSFVAQAPAPTITVTSSSGRIQGEVYSGSCGSLTCITSSSGNTSPKTLSPTGLTIGQTYYIRITTNNATTPTFTVCIVDPTVAAAPSNDNCSGATSLTPGSSCVNTAGTLAGATVSSPSVTSACGTPGADVWYSFTATSVFPTITLSSVGASIGTSYIQLLSGSCGSQTSIACASGTSLTPGGTGLTIGTTYYVRIYTANTYTGGSGWTFNICITNPGTSSTAVVDYSKSYINVTKLTTGGSVEPGDILEIRATFVVRSGTVDSIAFYDTLNNISGLTLLSSTIAERTNEGKIYRRDSPTKSEYTDASGDDAGWYTALSGGDTAIQINIGIGANSSARGRLVNSSRPSVYGGTCIVMATYRVQVYAGYNSTINWGGGAFTYKDGSNMKLVTLKNDYLTVYVSPGLCSSSLSTVNKIGIETDGTFNVPAVPSSGNRNRGTSTAVPSYTYAAFGTGTGPNDYYYGIANNTSATYTTINTFPKSTSGSSIPQRLFSHWDITGDHTGATNTSKGNPPCDYSLPVSSTNPCGYMLVVNAAYKTDTAFRSTITNLCPNTYYEISAWIKNICYKCGCDSNGVGAASGSSSYIPLTTNDSSGVQPNLAFQINGQDYYSTGNITYTGTGAGITQTGSDSMNTWVKRGFVYKTGASETGFEFLIRNNAPGGGGNDWAIDDIGISTCLPNMAYSPSTSPNVCSGNTLTINDTIRSSYENYTSYKWQRSTNGGSTWTDISPGGSGTGTAVWNGSTWQYVTSYAIPTSNTTMADSADQYRMIVATTSANLSDANCLFTEALNIITLNVLDCGTPLTTNLLSFNGKLVNEHAQLFWSTSKEDEVVNFDIEKSSDGINFSKIANISGYNNIRSEINYYSFIDPANFSGKSWYRIVMKNKKAGKKYSAIIQLNNEHINFGLSNIINPFSNELKFEINTTENTKIDVLLYDLFGKAVKNKNYMVYTGVNGISLENTGKLSPGIYILQVKNKDIIINSKVMKK